MKFGLIGRNCSWTIDGIYMLERQAEMSLNWWNI